MFLKNYFKNALGPDYFDTSVFQTFKSWLIPVLHKSFLSIDGKLYNSFHTKSVNFMANLKKIKKEKNH